MTNADPYSVYKKIVGDRLAIVSIARGSFLARRSGSFGSLDKLLPMSHNRPVESCPSQTDLPERLELQTVRNQAHAPRPDRPVYRVRYGRRVSGRASADSGTYRRTSGDLLQRGRVYFSFLRILIVYSSRALRPFSVGRTIVLCLMGFGGWTTKPTDRRLHSARHIFEELVCSSSARSFGAISQEQTHSRTITGSFPW